MRLTSIASFVVGMQMLRTNPLRTVLSTLGVIIGVASLVAILALGDGLERYTRGQIQSTTTFQMISVQPKTTDSFEGVLVRRDSVVHVGGTERSQLEAALGGRARVVLQLTGSAFVAAEGDSATTGALITASTAADPAGVPLAAGRFFDGGDVGEARSVAVISAAAATRLFGGTETAVGRGIRIAGAPFEVIGVLDTPPDDRIVRVLVPQSPAMRAALSDEGRRSPGLIVQVAKVENVPGVEQDVRGWLRTRFGSLDGFDIGSSTARAAQARQGVLVFKLAMGSITGISILVGGIGIMNVLLAAVTERTREIGVRRAAGARRADIFLQFIAESVAVSGLGSLVGVVVGLVGAFGITAMIRHFTEANLYAGFTWGTVLVAGLAAVFIGVAFGSYPARHAARLSPIEAIRHE
ncbi:MAG: ABC transporter permease [Gemmatimonadota bacterium]|jgi:putative ABC transport system permease protein